MTVTTVRTKYVYLAFHPASGLHKIGHSYTPRKRLLHEAKKAERVSIEHQFPSAAFRFAEKFLHEAFAHRRVKGEWFRLTDEEVAVFKAIPLADQEQDFPAAVIALRMANAEDKFVSRESLGTVNPPSRRGKGFLATAIPADLYERFKAFCRSRGTTMTYELTQAIKRHMMYPPAREIAPFPSASPAPGEIPAEAENPRPARAKKRKA